MGYREKIVGKQLYLKILEWKDDDNNKKYVKWMNDPEVNHFLYAKVEDKDYDALKEYVTKIFNSNDAYMFGIYTLEDDRYIGNVKLGSIHHYFKFADVGYMIGEKDVWGKGYGTEAVHLICKFGFNCLGLNRIISQCSEYNMGSRKVLEKNHFVLEGIMRKHVLIEGKGYSDMRSYGLLSCEFVGD